ncbi:MAG: hypothetical protein RJB68_2163 [Pseudomonadota bacterium]|jgi:hypothetical protein
MAKTNKVSALTDAPARENWARYLYGKDRGHLEYQAQAAICEGMYLGAGEQWRDADKAVLREQGRPFYEFNEVMPSVNSAIGYQIQNRMDIAFRPRGGKADMKMATVLNKVVKQIADQNKLHWRETQVYSDGLIEQRGYYDLRVSFDRNIKGEIDLNNLDPRDVIPDPDAKSYDPATWGDVIVSRWLLLSEIEQLYGVDARDRAARSGDEGTDFGDMDEETQRNRFGINQGSGRYDAYTNEKDGLKRYRVIDRQKNCYEMTQCLVWPDTGDIKVRDGMTAEQIEEAMASGAKQAKRMRKRVKWTVSTYSATLHDEFSPYEDFTIVPYFAYFRRGKTRGMVDNAIGPQEALNKAVSQNIHIVNTAANSGWVVEEGSLTNMETDELQKVGAKTGLVIEYRKGSQAPSKIQPNPVPQGVDRLIDRATQALKDVTVPDSMRGLQGNAVSGVAKQADQFASQQQLAVPLDNLAYTRNLLANRILKLVQKYYDSYRVFRITEMDPLTGKDVEITLEINKPDGQGGYLFDVTAGEYDVVITEQPMQVTFENSQFDQALSMRKEGVALPDAVVVKYSNLSDKHEIMQQMQGQQAPADPTLEAKAKLLEAQTRKTDADTTARSVEAQYSAIQTAQVIATTPATSGLADQLLRSAGYVDRDQAPIVPTAPPGLPVAAMPENTNPMTPANPGVGLMDGIETPAADGLAPQLGE